MFFLAMLNSSAKMMRGSSDILPVLRVKDEIVDNLKKNDCLLFMGDTGCGKTTQIPQLILKNHINEDGIIAITQPRRICAISIANRVAEEMKVDVGRLVGYNVRFKNMTNRETKIKYMTDGMLLKEAISDKNLLSYSVIILDEVHERTLNTDILMGVLKKAQRIRNKNAKYPNLKIVLMSATMWVPKFFDYFDNCVFMELEGRNFEVDSYCLFRPCDDYALQSVKMLFQVNRELPIEYGVLIFLTGQEEIESAANLVRQVLKYDQSITPMAVQTLYASLSDERQTSIFRRIRNKRKVIISTNVAETSITIPDIKVVIDSGKFKTRVYDPLTGFESLKVETISKEQALQREGRAGRQSDGFCYRIYTNDELHEMDLSRTAEITRSNLSNVVFILIDLGIDPKTFDYFERPDDNLIETALEELILLDAIDDSDGLTLTPFGKQLSLFPLNPKFGRILLKSIQMKCSDEILIVISLLSAQSIFIVPSQRRVDALTAHQQFYVNNSDHLTQLKVFKAFLKIELWKRKNWCRDHFLSYRNLSYALDVRNQLIKMFKEHHFDIVSCNNQYDVVRKCLLTGLFTQVAEINKNRSYSTLKAGFKDVYIHPSSILVKEYPKYVLFTEVIETEKCFIRDLSAIEYEWLHEIKNI